MTTTIEHRVLQTLLILLGVAAMGIALLVYTLGIEAITVTETAFGLLTGQAGPAARQPQPTIDSELRFYAPFWFSYGLLLIWVARDLENRLRFVLPLAAVFFAGGIGRLIAAVTVGFPHPAFITLGAIELVLPIVFMGLAMRLRTPHTA